MDVDESPSSALHRVPLRVAVRTWAYVGLNSFGGPAGQIAVMHREIVEHARWVSERRFLHALNTCMLLPGPEAMQLATYLGWLMHGVRGGLLAGSLFILPGFVTMLLLSMGYVLYGSLPWVEALLAGLQAAVVILVFQALIRISRRTLVTPALLMLAIASFLAIFAFNVPFPIIIIVSGVVGWLLISPRGRPQGEGAGATTLADEDLPTPGATRRAWRAAAGCLVLWLAPIVAIVLLQGSTSFYAQLSGLMAKAAVLTFGGAYAILGYVAQEAVGTYGWLTSEQMATGLGLAETTPGPLILVLQFVGFVAASGSGVGPPALVAGILAAFLVVWVIFVPAFMFVFLSAPVAERLRSNRAVTGALAAISAAVCGVILDLALWFAAHVLFASVQEWSWGPVQVFVPSVPTVQWPMVLVAVVAAVAVFAIQRIPTLGVLGICAGLGLLLNLGVALPS